MTCYIVWTQSCAQLAESLPIHISVHNTAQLFRKLYNSSPAMSILLSRHCIPDLYIKVPLLSAYPDIPSYVQFLVSHQKQAPSSTFMSGTAYNLTLVCLLVWYLDGHLHSLKPLKLQSFRPRAGGCLPLISSCIEGLESNGERHKRLP